VGCMGFAADGKNTIAFEYDLSCRGISPFTCSGGGYSGTLGLGGITSAAAEHTGPNGDMFFTTVEGDVWMNKGIANCAFPGFFTDIFPSAVTHEVGHTLGFRHADQTRADNPGVACETDPTLECAGTAMNPANAIMKSFVPSGMAGALQPWDQHAAAAVYPAPTAPSAITGVEAHSTSSTNVQVNWSGSCVTVCHIYRSRFNDKNTFDGPFSSAGPTGPFNDTAGNGVVAGRAYLYKVRNFNGTESPDSNLDLANTVVSSNIATGGAVVMAADINTVRDIVDAVRTLDGIGAGSYSFGSGSPVRISGGGTTLIHAADITEARTNLDTAMFGLFGSHPVFTNAITQNVSTVQAIDFNDFFNITR
jgi:hypothetical protein